MRSHSFTISEESFLDRYAISTIFEEVGPAPPNRIIAVNRVYYLLFIRGIKISFTIFHHF